MGGRGSGGSRSSGRTNNLSKQIDTISQRVYSNDDFAQNYSFYNNLSDDDLIQAEKLAKRKFETANKNHLPTSKHFRHQNLMQIVILF